MVTTIHFKIAAKSVMLCKSNLPHYFGVVAIRRFRVFLFTVAAIVAAVARTVIIQRERERGGRIF